MEASNEGPWNRHLLLAQAPVSVDPHLAFLLRLPGLHVVPLDAIAAGGEPHLEGIVRFARLKHEVLRTFIKPTLSGLDTAARFRLVEDELFRRYGPGPPQRICSGNALRVLRRAWQGGPGCPKRSGP